MALRISGNNKHGIPIEKMYDRFTNSVGVYIGGKSKPFITTLPD